MADSTMASVAQVATTTEQGDAVQLRASPHICGSSTMGAVEAALIRLGMRAEDAKELCAVNGFCNTGNGRTSGEKLFKAAKTCGPEALVWIWRGVTQAGKILSITTITKYLESWSRHCSKQPDASTVERCTELVRPADGTSKSKRCWLPFFVTGIGQDGKPVVSPRIVAFVEGFYPAGSIQGPAMNITMSWLLASLNAELAAMKVTAHFKDGFLRAEFSRLMLLSKQVWTSKTTSTKRRADGSCVDIHKYKRATVGLQGILAMVTRLQEHSMFKTSTTQQQTLAMIMQLYFGGLRFVSAGGVLFHNYAMEFYPALGADGKHVLTFILDDGKGNRNGNFEKTGCVSHRNPRMCFFTAWMENVLIILRQPRVRNGKIVTWFDITDPDDFNSIALYDHDDGAPSKATTEADRKRERFGEHMKSLLQWYNKSNGDLLPSAYKQAHQPRKECIQALQAASVQKSNIDYFLKKFDRNTRGGSVRDDELRKSYWDPCDTACMTTMGGFDHRYFTAANAPHLDASIGAPNCRNASMHCPLLAAQDGCQHVHAHQHTRARTRTHTRRPSLPSLSQATVTALTSRL